jgi:hypothetical protein
MEESKSWMSLLPEFFQQLSQEDKDKVNILINKDIK